MSKKTIQWLMREIAAWEAEGVVDAAVAERVRARYAGALAGAGRNLALAAFGIIGALLMGAGVLLLLAHNWADVPRWGRTALALLPLAAAQGIALHGVRRGRDSTAWREAVGLFWFLATGGAVAMVGQIYHLPGSFDRFALTWALLALPVVWLLRSSIAGLGYLALAVAWMLDRSHAGNLELWFWPLALGLVPALWANRREEATAAGSLLWWGLAVALMIGTASTLARAVPGVWLIVYAAWAGIFLLADHRWFRSASSVWHRPLLPLGLLGGIVLMLVFTFEGPWRNIGWHHYRPDADVAWRQVLDGVVAVGLGGAAAALLLAERRRLAPSRFALGLLPVAALAGFAAASSFDRPGVAMLLFNLYGLATGVLFMVDGFRAVRPGDVNAGLLAVGSLVVLRFFDSEQSILLRAGVFLALGAVFLAVNVVLARRKKVQA